MQSIEVQAAGRRVKTTITVTREEGGSWALDIPGRDVEVDVDVSGYVYTVGDQLGVSLLEAESSLSDEERALAEEALMEAWRRCRDEVNATLSAVDAADRCVWCGEIATSDERYCSAECAEADRV